MILAYRKIIDTWQFVGEFPNQDALKQIGQGEYKVYTSYGSGADGMPTGFRNAVVVNVNASIVPKI